MLEQISDLIPDRKHDFLNRHYEEKFSEAGLLHTLSDAMLWEPDIVYKYFNRTDSLILVIYNKIHEDRQYETEWTADYRVMPGFSNWIDHFNASHPPQVPLFDIDDRKIGAIHDKI